MFSDFMYIDVNGGYGSTERCVWFTIPLSSYEEEENGEKVIKYSYMSFPCTAISEDQIEYFVVDNFPYIPSMKYMY